MSPVLLDTGPVVALLDAADERHGFVQQAFAGLPRGRPFVTTGAVVTEILFLLQGCPEGARRAVAFLEDAKVRVEDVFAAPQLRAAAILIEKYADVPMDFADATLVLLADFYGTGDIVTLDERGFRAFRFQRRRAFHLLLQDGQT